MEQESGLGENGKTCIKSSYLFLFPLLSLSSPFPLRQARQKKGYGKDSFLCQPFPLLKHILLLKHLVLFSSCNWEDLVCG